MDVLLDPDARPVVGHRGAAAHAPENTLVSFARALDDGADALELDVRVTADGVPVVHHDAVLERTTDGRGAVGAHTLAELRRLDAGARFTRDGGRTHPYRGTGVVVPTLAEVLTTFPATSLIVEIKTASASAAVRALLERHGAERRCVVASFVAAALDPFRGTAFALGATQRDVARLLAATLRGARLGAAPAYQVASVPRRWRRLPLPIAGFVRLLRPWGRTVHVWTVDDPAVAAVLWRGGVQGVISNDPRAVRGAAVV